MKLSQKKNCNGCKAGWYSTQPYTAHCDLHYSVTSKGFVSIPEEPCYKPLTNSKYMTARKIVFKT